MAMRLFPLRRFEIRLNYNLEDDNKPLCTYHYVQKKLSRKHTQLQLNLVQGVPKGTDTFQSFMIKKLDNLRKFFSYQ